MTATEEQTTEYMMGNPLAREPARILKADSTATNKSFHCLCLRGTTDMSEPSATTRKSVLFLFTRKHPGLECEITSQSLVVRPDVALGLEPIDLNGALIVDPDVPLDKCSTLESLMQDITVFPSQQEALSRWYQSMYQGRPKALDLTSPDARLTELQLPDHKPDDGKCWGTLTYTPRAAI